MPSDAIDSETAAKLDAAYAIAALSSGRWPTILKKNAPGRSVSCKQGGTISTDDCQKSIVHHVSASVIPARINNSKPRKRKTSKKEVLNNRCEAAAINESHHNIVMKLIEQDENGGQFVQSVSAVNDINNTELDVRTPNEGLCPVNSYLNTHLNFLQNTAPFSGEMERISRNVLDLNGIQQHDVMLQIQRLLASGMSFQIVPLPNVLTPGIANNRSTNAQLVTTSPQFLQFVQCSNGLEIASDRLNTNVNLATCIKVNEGSFNHIVNVGRSANHVMTESSINHILNGGSVNHDVSEVGKSERDKMKNADLQCHSHLPGSLSTLRNYYKSPAASSSVTSTSLHLAPSEITSTITTSSLSVLLSPSSSSTINVSEVTDNKIKSLSCVLSSRPPVIFDSVNVRTATETEESRVTTIGTDQLLYTDRHDCPADTATDEINLTNFPVPGSLSILRQFYDSYNQDAKSRSTDNARHVVDAAAESSISVRSDQPLLNQPSYLDDGAKTQRADESHCHKNSKKISSSLLSHHRQSKKKAKQISKPFSHSCTELDENGCKNFTGLLKSFPFGKDISASSLPPAPVHVLPQIHNFRNQTSPTMQRSPKKNESDPVICLPPKKRKRMTSTSSVFEQKESCVVLQGGQMLTLNNFKEFLNRLLQYDRNAYQQFMDQIKSANVGNPLMESVPLLLDEISNESDQTNAIQSGDHSTKPLQSSSGQNPVNRIQSRFVQKNLEIVNYCQTKRIQSDKTGRNLLPCSISSSASSSNQRLLNHHHPVLQQDEDGDLPLHVAVAQGSLDVIDRLLQLMNQLNASVNCRNNLRQTPLHLAVIIGDYEIVRHLLVAGACPNVSDRNGQNSFHLAVQYNHIECLQCLFSDAKVPVSLDLMNYEGMTALHLAVRRNLPQLVVVLLQDGANCDIVDGKSGHTALYMAADSNRLQIAEILLSSGANIQIASYSGCSPVQAASSKSFADMVKLFIRYGASEQAAENTSDANYKTGKTVTKDLCK